MMMGSRSLLLFILLLPLALLGQTHFRKYEVAQTGVTVYFPANPGAFTHELSPDSSQVYTGSATTSDSLKWGVFLVRLSTAVRPGDQNDLLKAYLDYLKDEFGVKDAAGYGEGHTLDANPGTTGIIDYWEDVENNVWEVKGWINPNYLCVLYVAGHKTIEKNFESTRFFFNSIRFPNQ